MAKFIFITGGVVSSLGKGIATASIGALLSSRGYKVCLKKLDPYLNVDPGTMSPLQHGEVFVTDDGGETDLDLGHYERFTDYKASKHHSITAGKIYEELLRRERNGDYLGATVQIIPHVTNLIKEYIQRDSEQYDFVLCEVGGTVGDIESLPFIEAARQMSHELPENSSVFVHLTLIPYIASAKELKSKPTQHSVKELMSLGVMADIIICRSSERITDALRDKLSLFCNVRPECIISCPDVEDVYGLPIAFSEDGLDTQVLRKLGIDSSKTKSDLTRWKDYMSKVQNAKKEVRIAIAGKYNECKDAYKSIIESLQHSSINQGAKLTLEWINVRDKKAIEQSALKEQFENVDGVVVPGGFGEDGIRGKMEVIKYARENNIPLLGICLGMQLAVIEYARHVVEISDANSEEFDHKCVSKVVHFLKDWQDENGGVQVRTSHDQKGGTMRLGLYPAKLKAGSLLSQLYGKEQIQERHRHRFEINVEFKDRLEEHGLVFSGMSSDERLPEAMELVGHKFFVASQYHPELLSRPFKTHPLFDGLIKAALTE